MGMKSTLDKIHGRELTWDEFFLILPKYLDLPAEKSIVLDVTQRLVELKTHLENNREGRAAFCVEVFMEALVAGLQGREDITHLAHAIIDTGGSKP